jgi:hypothetical protein
MSELPDLPLEELINRELGGNSREKVNEIVRFINNIDQLLPPGPPGPPGPEGVPGKDLNVLLNVIGVSEDEGGFPENANLGDAWLIVGDGTAAETKVYIWTGEEWIFAFEFTVEGDRSFLNVFYVTKAGSDDDYDGFTPEKSFLTIGRALQAARELTNPSVVKVYPGTYVEDGNLEIPQNSAVVSDGGQYATEVIASQACRDNFRNMFLVNSGSYVQGFTFRNQKIDNFNNPSGGFAVAFAPGATILRSPYIRDCSQVSNYEGDAITNPLEQVPDGYAFDDDNYTVDPNPLVGPGGGMILADRSVLGQNSIFPSMMAFGATPRSPNGIGYCVKNGAYLNGISAISIFTQCGFFALNGGQLSLNNSGTQFGDISMRSRGFTWVVSPLSATVTNKSTSAADIIVADQSSIVDGMWDDLVVRYGSLVNTPELETEFRRAGNNLCRALRFDLRDGGDEVTKSYALTRFNYEAEYIFDQTLLSPYITAWQYIRDEVVSLLTGDSDSQNAVTDLVDTVLIGTVNGAPPTENVESIDSDVDAQLSQFIGTNSDGTTPKVLDEDTLTLYEYDDEYDTWDDIGETLKLKFGSLIESLSHQFNNAGAGVNSNAMPLNIRKPGQNRDVPFTVLRQDLGRVRWSGADERNNQYFAGGTRINGITGKLEGRPFTSGVRQIARRISNSRGLI